MFIARLGLIAQLRTDVYVGALLLSTRNKSRRWSYKRYAPTEPSWRTYLVVLRAMRV